MSTAAIVESISDAARTVNGEIGKQIDHLALAATAIDQSFYRIPPCPAAFAADDAQTAKPRTKIAESDGAVTRHRVTSERQRELWTVRDCYRSSVTLSRIIILADLRSRR